MKINRFVRIMWNKDAILIIKLLMKMHKTTQLSQLI